MHGVYLPVSSGPDTFVQALSTSGEVSLFSKRELKVLVILSFLAFAVPLILSVIVLKRTAPETALRIDPNQVAQIAPGQISEGNDDLAMAEIFLDKANENLSNPQVSEQYISEAKSLLSLSTQTGPKVDALNQRLTALVSPSVQNPVLPTQVRVAAPAGSPKTSLSGETQSNAVSNSVVMKSGTKSLFVPYSALKDDTQIYVTIPNNRENATVYVVSRAAGTGFTLASTAPLMQDITVVWYEIKSQ